MKIKNLKYIFGFIVFQLSFFCNIILGSGCSSDLRTGYDNDVIRVCSVPNGNPLPYNNSIQLQDFPSNAQVFLKMIGINWIPCTPGNEGASQALVRSIQSQMQSISGNCSTCNDGKIGNFTKTAMSNCPAELCKSPKQPPTLEGSSLACNTSAGYFLRSSNSVWCCELVPPLNAPTMEELDWDNVLSVDISILVTDDYYADELFQDDTKITASNNDGPIPRNKINFGAIQQLSNGVKCNVQISVTGSDVTVSLGEGFYYITDNVRNSPQIEQTFHWEGGEITGPTIEQVSWEGNTLVVNIAYELVGIDSPSVDCRVPDKIEIVGGTQNGAVPNASVPSCQLTITTEGDEVTINVKSGVIVGGGMESSPGSQTLTKPQQCGSTPKTDSGCDETYGPSYTLSGICCVTQCSTPQKTGGGCNPGYSKDDNGCCVANNCQNLPAEGNDCSNWGGMWSYSEDSGCCVKGESCLEPATPPTNGQCVSPYVFDQAGECCTNCSNPLHDDGTCDQGYTAQGGCCFPDDRCGENQINQGGQCKACEEEGTKPNEAHTRCICDPDKKCCGVQLNNVVPFIGDCIEMNAESSRDTTTNVNSVTAFPILMQGLMKILMSVIMIFSFLMIIVAGLMIVSGAFGGNGFATGKKIIKNVIISLILLGCSGLILSLINPSFFGG